MDGHARASHGIAGPGDERPKAAGLYARVSGPNQTTVPEQLRLCRDKAESIGIPVRYVLHDDGLKAQNLDRPHFQRLMAHAEARRIDAIVVWKLDRMVRSLTDFLNVNRWLEAHGVALISVTEPFDTSTSFGRFSMRGIVSAAELEKDLIAERVRLGRARQEADGRWIGWQTPLGYERAPDGRLQVCNAERPLVWSIFNRYARGMAITELARRLGDEGIRSRRGTPFSPGSLHFILTNRIYIGEERIRTTVRKRPELRLVSPRMWKAVQGRKGKRAKAARPETRREVAVRNVFDAYDAFLSESEDSSFSSWLGAGESAA